MTCLQCGHENSADLIECENCGEVVVDVFGSNKPADEGTSFIDVDSRGSTVSAAAPMTADQAVPGVVVGGRYEILEQIGEGGMGCVYKVRDQELDKVIALKLIRSEQAGDPTTVQRFKQELILARQVTHKNVVRIYDFGEADGLKFFTMEYIDGESLKDVIRRSGGIQPTEALPWIRQMLEALREAHLQGVIHRDLKPQNIMIDRNGEARLMDFGIARATDTNTMTATGAVMGTPDYISPEQAYGEKADRQSDLYSFGVILFEMLTGELPFQGESPVSRVVARLTKKPKTPKELNGDLPDYLERVIFKCMEVDRELRYRDAVEILNDLDREDVDRTVLLKIKRRVGRSKWILGAAAAAILTIAAGRAWIVARGEDPLPEEPVTTLAVLPFTNATESEELEWMRTGVPEMIITDMSQSKLVRPVPGERVAKLLRELGAENQKRFDEATIEAIAEMAPAQSVLYGQFAEAGGQIRLDLDLRDSETGAPTPILVKVETDQVFTLVDEITQKIKGHLDLTPEQLKGDTDRPVAEVSTSSIEALQAYQEGLEKLRQGGNQQAIPLFQRACETDTEFAMAHAKLAEAYLAMGEYEPAEKAIERATALSGNLSRAERYQVHAISALIKSDFEVAVKSYQDLAALFPNDPDILLSLARAIDNLGQWPKAIETYEMVLALNPGHGAALVDLGRVQMLHGQNDEAIRSLEKALQIREFQDNWESMGMIHSILGVAFRETGRTEEAIEHLNRSLDFRRKAGDGRGQAVTLTNLAVVYEQRGQIDRALEVENQALSLAREIGDRPVESQVLLNLGLTYQVAGNLDSALKYLRQSMRIERDLNSYTDFAIRLDYIADIYRILGQYDDALIYLEQAKSRLAGSGDQQEQASNHLKIGVIKGVQGRYKESTESLLTALTLFREIEQPQGIAAVQLRLAEIYGSLGRYADANQALQSSFEISQDLGLGHDLAEVQAHVGCYLLTVGQFGDAEKKLQQALETAKEAQADGLMPFIFLSRGKLLRLQGKIGEAARALESAAAEAVRLGQKDVIYRSRTELARIYLLQNEVAKAESLLVKNQEEVRLAHVLPLEAEVARALAEVHLAAGDAEAARETALAGILLAKSFSGLPLLLRLNSVLGEANEQLNRFDESLEAYTEVATAFSRIASNLPKESIQSYMKRPDRQEILARTLAVLKKYAEPDAEAIEKWIHKSGS